ILEVTRGSLADMLGIRAGETLTEMNGEPVLDEIDYQALSAALGLVQLKAADPDVEIRGPLDIAYRKEYDRAFDGHEDLLIRTDPGSGSGQPGTCLQ
ncbi:MAG: hypothetical protein IIY74_03195, partial [Firmicutes bacterium]|nr:hypothetical protein [Bacillota bacterium]